MSIFSVNTGSCRVACVEMNREKQSTTKGQIVFQEVLNPQLTLCINWEAFWM